MLRGMFTLIGWLILGLIAGALARFLMPGRQQMGLIATTLLGIGGSFIGGFLGSLLFGYNWRVLRPSGFIGSVIGALVLLFIAQQMKKK
jgi:uncharacterized membrane protein YeaQ/YmgE (transglycosylase-associated protein family)